MTSSLSRGDDVVVVKDYLDDSLHWYSFVAKGTKGVIRKMEDGFCLLATTVQGRIKLVWVPEDYIAIKDE